MTVLEAITQADDIAPNTISQGVKLRLLNQLEAELATEVLMVAQEELANYQYSLPADQDKILLAAQPYEGMYVEWLRAWIFQYQNEYSWFNNAITMFNELRQAYERSVAIKANPGAGTAILNGYYLSAYAIAKNNGFTGSEAEWIESLKGNPGDPGIGITGAKVNPEGHLVLTMSNGTTIDCGEVGGTADCIKVTRQNFDHGQKVIACGNIGAVNQEDVWLYGEVCFKPGRIDGEIWNGVILRSENDENDAATLKVYDESRENPVRINGVKTPEQDDDAANKAYVDEKAVEVPDWAKQPNKPTYTAAEVGAATRLHVHTQYAAKEDITEALKAIPNPTGDFDAVNKVYADATYVEQQPGKGLSSNDFTNDAKSKLDGVEVGANKYSLPVANNSTLGGVKPVEKMPDMTQSVGIDEDGRLYTAPSGGGGGGSADTSDCVKVTQQSFNSNQKIIACGNIGAVNQRDVWMYGEACFKPNAPEGPASIGAILCAEYSPDEGSILNLYDESDYEDVIIRGVKAPNDDRDAANKAYVDEKVASAGGGGGSYATAEMTLLADVNIREATPLIQLTNLNDITEFFIIFDDCQNATTTTDGFFSVRIGEDARQWAPAGVIIQPSVIKRSGTEHHRFMSLRYNGKFWIPFSPNGANLNGMSNETQAFSTYDINENSDVAMHPAKAITLVTFGETVAVSGRVRIWGR